MLSDTDAGCMVIALDLFKKETESLLDQRMVQTKTIHTRKYHDIKR